MEKDCLEIRCTLTRKSRLPGDNLPSHGLEKWKVRTENRTKSKASQRTILLAVVAVWRIVVAIGLFLLLAGLAFRVRSR